MALRLMERIGRFLRAEGHGVVDALEDRRLLLRQHLRDAELELLQKRARLRALEKERTRLEEDAERRRRRLVSLDGDVDLALAAGKEDLARYAAARLLPERGALDEAERRIAGVEQARALLAERLSEQEERFRELRERVREHLARLPEAGEETASPCLAADQEVELELVRRRAAAEGP